MRWFCFTLLLLLAGGLEGCRSPAAPPLADDVGRLVRSPSTLTAGSVVEIRFFYTPELDVIQAVRPDGSIAMPLLGDVEVAGMGPQALREELLHRYQGELEDPEITVLVQSMAHQHILVGGEVRTPGLIEMPADMTVLQALMRAGGPDAVTANVENVIVIRDTGEARESFAVNLQLALSGEPEDRPFYLEPQDIVFVPRTRIVNLDTWVDQNINRLVPQIGLTYSRTAGPARFGIDTSTRGSGRQ